MRVAFLCPRDDGSQGGVSLNDADAAQAPLARLIAQKLVESLRGPKSDTERVLHLVRLYDLARLDKIRACVGLDARAALDGDKAAEARAMAVTIDAEVMAYRWYKDSLVADMER